MSRASSVACIPGSACAGGVIGVLVAFATFGLLLLMGHMGITDGRQQVMPGAVVSIGGWIAVLLLPLCAGAIGLVTARLTVLRALSRLP